MHDRFYQDFGTHTRLFLQQLKLTKETTTAGYNNYINNFQDRKKYQSLA